MQALEHWLIGMTAAALLCALCQAMMPEGAAKTVSRLTAGLLLFLSVVRPVLQLDTDALLDSIASYADSLSGYETDLDETDDSWQEQYIISECGTYIEHKAEEQGFSVHCEIMCSENEEGLMVPRSAQVTGTLTQAEQAQVLDWMRSDLNIDGERVTFILEEGAM